MFQPGLLAGKRILVTGGGTGPGKTMGRRYVELGAELVICGRHYQVGRRRTGGDPPEKGLGDASPDPIYP